MRDSVLRASRCGVNITSKWKTILYCPGYVSSTLYFILCPWRLNGEDTEHMYSKHLSTILYILLYLYYLFIL